MTRKKTSNVKEAAVIKVKEETIRVEAKKFTPTNTAQKVTDLQLQITKQLQEAGQRATDQIKELETLGSAIELAKEEFSKVQDVTLLSKEFDEVVADYEEKRNILQREFDEFSRQTDDNRTLKVKEYNQFLNDQKEIRARSETQYQYDWTQKVRDTKAAFDEEVRTLRNQERDRREALEKDWKSREESLKKQETEVAELRKQVEEFPTKLDAEVKKAQAIEGHTVKRDYTHQMELLKKDFETSQKISDSTIKQLNDTIKQLSTQLAEAFARNNESEKKVQSIAEKALDAASSQKALTDLQNFQQTTGTNNSGRKQA